ncbi:uncharacterized protein LOC110538617 [Oncorhynchus mykiss]|nr:uncharacterized protein LOC110538617 [Oncorhynchus mykiss]
MSTEVDVLDGLVESLLMKRRIMSVCGMTGPGLGLSVFLLALLHLQCSAQNNYTTLPNNVSVAVGKPAAFQCGVSPPRQLNFTLYGSHRNITLICPGDHTEYLAAQSIKGYCDNTGKELFAIWLISGTSRSDNHTRVVCESSGRPLVDGYLWVYEDGSYFATLIGCVIGGFFGILIVFGLSYTVLRRSERFQLCFRGKDREDDVTTMVTKD